MLPDSSAEMMFKENGKPVKVDFYKVTLVLHFVNSTDNTETPHSWDMSIGYISPEYQSSAYFDNFKENMLGLAPMQTDDEALLNR